jgi:hypothetical protein
MDTRPCTENELWLLSFYRTSEISGALLFGRLARSMRPGKTQADMTQHFADEAAHSAYWTRCIQKLGHEPLKLATAYQDQYLEAAGLPVNIMEVLSITQVFEQRVLNQYTKHLRVADLQPEVAATLHRIMDDEKWHVQWVRQALEDLEYVYGRDHIEATRRRHRDADRLVYAKTMAEHESRLDFMLAAA